jgi:hypothetical protein
MALLPWRRRSTVVRKWAEDRLEELILERCLQAKHDGDDDLAVQLWDASRKMRRVIPRATWRSLANYDEAQLRHIVALMVEPR